jgi:hypothetical protein
MHKTLTPAQSAASYRYAAKPSNFVNRRISRLLINSIRRLQLLLYSRPLFRICDVVCSHIARLADGGPHTYETWTQDELDRINFERIQIQHRLHDIAASHARICSDCQGRCCKGTRERDTFIDRVLQNPLTPHRSARGPRMLLSFDTGKVVGYCSQLTPQGCRLPFEQRPIQCVTYFCNTAIASFSPEQYRIATSCIVRLINVELKVAMVTIRTRLRHLRTNILTAKQNLADCIGKLSQR